MGQRFRTDFVVNRTEDEVGRILMDFFRREGFELTDYEGERVWKKGIGLLTAPQFMKISYRAGWIHLEAWIKFAILPGVYCGEMGLDGFFGYLVKDQLKTRVYELIRLLQPVPRPTAPGQPAPAMPQGAAQPPLPPSAQPMPLSAAPSAPAPAAQPAAQPVEQPAPAAPQD